MFIKRKHVQRYHERVILHSICEMLLISILTCKNETEIYLQLSALNIPPYYFDEFNCAQFFTSPLYLVIILPDFRFIPVG